VSERKGGLGRGLSSLIPTEAAATSPETADGTGLLDVPVADIVINQYQPRRHFDEEELVSLTASVREIGVLQPILVRLKPDGGYELIAGERRWRAAKRAGLDRIPAVVRKIEDQAALEQAVVENLHRADLNALEEAHAYQQLIDEFSLTQDQVATRVGKSRSAVANTLRLFQLTPVVQRMIMQGELSAGHARAILGADAPDQEALAARAIEDGLSVRALEQIVRGDDNTVVSSDAESASGEDTMSAPVPDTDSVGETRPAAILELEALLADHLETRVGVATGAKRGRIVIDFADVDDLERVSRLILEADPG